jgi:chromosome segregation ATPase
VWRELLEVKAVVAQLQENARYTEKAVDRLERKLDGLGTELKAIAEKADATSETTRSELKAELKATSEATRSELKAIADKFDSKFDSLLWKLLIPALIAIAAGVTTRFLTTPPA